MKLDINKHVYYPQYLEGRNGASKEHCPYTIVQIGARCAWIAGFNDALRERKYKQQDIKNE